MEKGVVGIYTNADTPVAQTQISTEWMDDRNASNLKNVVICNI